MYANTKALEMAGGVKDFFSSIGKTPGPLGIDHSPVFARFRSPVATPCDGSLPTVFFPPPAAPTRWGLDERGAGSYHDLLLQWSQHEHLSELSLGRATFQRARTDVYPLEYAASVLELNHSRDENQVRAAAARASLYPRYTVAHIAEQLEVIVAHIRTSLPPSGVAPPLLPGAATGDTTPAAPVGGRADVAMGLGDEPGPPPEQADGITAPLAPPDESDDDDGSDTGEGETGDVVMRPGDERAATAAAQLVSEDEPLHVPVGDEHGDEFITPPPLRCTRVH